MRRIGGLLPTSPLFSPPARLEVLRTLASRREGMTGRSLARAAGLAPQTCAEAVRALAGMGVLTREVYGKCATVVLNLEHALVRDLLLPLFEKEESLAGAVRANCYRELDAVAYKIRLGDLFCGTRDTIVVVLPQHREEAERIVCELSAGLEEGCDLKAGFRVIDIEES